MSVNPLSPEKPTIADVARELGVSKATVSYALNGRKGVSAATRRRIVEKAESMGYGGRTRLSAHTKRPGAVGAILSPTQADDGPNYYVAELLMAAERHCRQHGYSLVITSEDGASAVQENPEVQGLLYLGGSFAPEVVADNALPTVLVGAPSTSWSCDSVLADNQQAAFLATSHLVSMGRHRLAFINGPDRTPTSRSKHAGFLEALTVGSIDVAQCPIVQGDFSPQSGYRLAMELLSVQGPQRPNGLFVADDPMALGVLHALLDLGLEVPRDVAVIGLGDSSTGKVSRPTLSTVGVFQEDLGRIGAKLLIERIDGDSGPVQRILLRPELILRGTTDENA